MQIITFLFLASFCVQLDAQFYFGADQSYVNEMEDCGADFKENGQPKDVYQIFADHGCNLVRLRLWHTPSWYDGLNQGKRYSDLNDVKKSIARAKAQGMEVLLDFHLSDNWADPSKQIIPAAWMPVADHLDALKDSLYNYIFYTLTTLNAEGLLPEMVQIGNETNRGILLTPEQNQEWTLEWDRNAPLFNRAIEAVRDVAPNIKVALHLADPSEIEWLMSDFTSNGVTDFDVIAMSYYWAWHKPTTIKETGEVIARLKTNYPDKDVLIVETGYIWTTESQDQAGNIISEVHPDFSPASPQNQRKWLVELTKEVLDKDGMGVIYWEPSWVSTPCSTQWGQGSHQEHATFFDFDHDLLLPGGIEWMSYPYIVLSTETNYLELKIKIVDKPDQKKVNVEVTDEELLADLSYMISDTSGQVIKGDQIYNIFFEISTERFVPGVYVLTIFNDDQRMSKKIVVR